MKQYASFRAMQDDLLHGTISCTQVVQHYLANIRSSSHLNAFLSVYEKDALDSAATIDQKLKTTGAGKLAGMVVGIKDVLAYSSHPLQSSSKILEGFTAPYTATAVQRLLDEEGV